MKPLDQDPCHRWDKLGLFTLAGLAIGIIAAVVIGAYWTGEVPKNAEGLMGTIVAGVLLFMRDIVAAIRAGWEEITRGRTNEQLAKGGPPLPAGGDEPLAVRVEQPKGEPVPVKDANA